TPASSSALTTDGTQRTFGSRVANHCMTEGSGLTEIASEITLVSRIIRLPASQTPAARLQPWCVAGPQDQRFRISRAAPSPCHRRFHCPVLVFPLRQFR